MKNNELLQEQEEQRRESPPPLHNGNSADASHAAMHREIDGANGKQDYLNEEVPSNTMMNQPLKEKEDLLTQQEEEAQQRQSFALNLNTLKAAAENMEKAASSSSSSSLLAQLSNEKSKLLKSSAGGGTLVRITIVQEPLHGKALGFQQRYGSFLDPALIICIDLHNDTSSNSSLGSSSSFLGNDKKTIVTSSTLLPPSSAGGPSSASTSSLLAASPIIYDAGSKTPNGKPFLNSSNSEGRKSPPSLATLTYSKPENTLLHTISSTTSNLSSTSARNIQLQVIASRLMCHLQLIDADTGRDSCVLDMQASLEMRGGSRGDNGGSGGDDHSLNGQINTGGGQYQQLLHDNFKAASHPVLPRLLIDPEDGRERIYFVFGEISVRSIGKYKIRVRLMDMVGSNGLIRGGGGVPMDGAAIVLETSIFRVVSPREYSGNKKATKLSKSFASQGVLFLGRSR